MNEQLTMLLNRGWTQINSQRFVNPTTDQVLERGHGFWFLEEKGKKVKLAFTLSDAVRKLLNMEEDTK